MKIKTLFLLTGLLAAMVPCSFRPTADTESAVPYPYNTVCGDMGNPEEISPAADNIIWITKTENGKIYMRQYNTSTNQWIGDWIYVGDCP